MWIELKLNPKQDILPMGPVYQLREDPMDSCEVIAQKLSASQVEAA